MFFTFKLPIMFRYQENYHRFFKAVLVFEQSFYKLLRENKFGREFFRDIVAEKNKKVFLLDVP